MFISMEERRSYHVGAGVERRENHRIPHLDSVGLSMLASIYTEREKPRKPSMETGSRAVHKPVIVLASTVKDIGRRRVLSEQHRDRRQRELWKWEENRYKAYLC